jgi:cell division protein FtsI/penicillin-binding protein 2
MACSLLSAAKENGNALYASAPDGTTLRYTINTDMQQSMQSYLESKQPPYAFFIAIEPSTGRIISINSASNDPAWNLGAAYRLFPMASLFKMVTAAAALENSKINPSTEMAYRGKAVSENPLNWDPRPKGASHRIDMTEAMGKSINPVYGKVASDLLGKETLSTTCNNFGFNRPIFSGIPVETSQANVPETVNGLRLFGSGLDHELKVSPLHAAAITAAFANKGVMMSPRLVDSIIKNGKESQASPSREVARIVQPGVAKDITRMLLTTATTGTSGKAFRTQDGRRLLTAMNVAAKTGTINGDNPVGQHTWFAAYAPAEKPRIAVLALIINDGRWKIKASNVGEHALVTYFRPEIEQIPVQVAPVHKSVAVKKKSRAKTAHHQAARKKNARSSRQGKGG